MELGELLGKRITNIYGIIEYESYGLDTAECFIELDNKIFIDIPSGHGNIVWEKDLENNAVTIIPDKTDETYIDQTPLLEKLSNLLKEKPKFIKNRKIVDFIWYPDKSYDSGFLLLDNGVVIGETKASMNGTGLVGLNYYKSLKSLTERKGSDYLSLTSQ